MGRDGREFAASRFSAERLIRDLKMIYAALASPSEP